MQSNALPPTSAPIVGHLVFSGHWWREKSLVTSHGVLTGHAAQCPSYEELCFLGTHRTEVQCITMSVVHDLQPYIH